MNLVGFCLCLIVLFAFIWENEGRRSCGKNRLAMTEARGGCGKAPLAEEDPVDRKEEKSNFSYDLAKAGNFPSLVTIFTQRATGNVYTPVSRKYCSGVLVSNRLVITKASCLTGVIEIATTFTNPEKWKPDTKRYRPKKICKSPKFKKTNNYGWFAWDFAVVYLEEAVELSDKVQTACLADSDDLTSLRDGKQYWLAAEPQDYHEAIVNPDPNLNRLVPVEHSDCGLKEDESHLCRQPIDKKRYTCYDRRYTGPLMSIDKPAVVYGFAIYGNGTSKSWLESCESSSERIVFSNLAKHRNHIRELAIECMKSD